MKVSSKIISLMAVLIILILGGSSFYIVSGINDTFTNYVLDHERREVELGSAELGIIFEDIQEDVLFLKDTPPIQGMFRARDGDGYDSLENSTLEDWKSRLSYIFSSLLESKDVYYQARYIDEEGNEVVRVDRIEDEIVIVEEEDLQYKGDRFYFEEANALEEGGLYVSNPSLNKEGSPPQIEVPYNPVIRYAVPVFDHDKDNERRGVIITNIYLNKVFEKFNFDGEGYENVYLVDQDGYYLINPDESKEWGSSEDLNTGENLSRDYSDMAERILNMSNAGLEETDENIYFFEKVYLDKDEADPAISITFFKDASKNAILSPFYTIFSKVAWIGGAAFLLAFLIIWLSIRRILKPLGVLTEASKQIGQGDFSTKLEIQSNDEIGLLGQVFNKTAGELQELYTKMDNKVKERTRNIEKAKKELGIASRRLKLATEAAQIGIWEWDLVKNKLIWDKQMYTLYGAKNSDFEISYRIWQEMVYPDDLKRVEREINKALKKEKPFDTSFRIIWLDETIHHVRAFALVLRNKKDEPQKMIGVNWDITAEKEVDQAKTEFVSLASHQLKTPLTSISWYSEMLLSNDAGKLNSKQRDFLNEVYKGNKRMINLVDDLLNVSRIDLGTFIIEPKKVDLKEMADSVLKELRPLIDKKKTQIKKKYGKGITSFNTDPDLTRMIIQNLLSNAIKYTPNKGKVSLSIGLEGDDMIIKVKDNGYGIPKKQQARIFFKFFRADNIQKKDVKGNGLGLYIIKSVVDKSGGKVWFDSEEGKGTTFYVSFPKKGMKKKKGSKRLD